MRILLYNCPDCNLTLKKTQFGLVYVSKFQNKVCFEENVGVSIEHSPTQSTRPHTKTQCSKKQNAIQGYSKTFSAF